MSVDALTENSCINSPAKELSVFMQLIASLINSSEASPFFMAVEIIPDPNGFVSTKASPS